MNNPSVESRAPGVASPTKPDRRWILRPLAPTTYLLRNAGKTIPLIGVIMLAVMLVAGIISMINSIPYSIKTIYSYSKTMLGISPRGDNVMTPQIVSVIKKESPVPIGRVIVSRTASATVQSIVGKWRFFVIGLEQKDFAYYLARMGTSGVQGRLPKPGTAEAVVSQPVAQNLGLRLGSTLMKPDDTDNYSPYKVTVVGIANTKMWLMMSDIEYLRANHFPPVDIPLVFARDIGQQPRLDAWAQKRFVGSRAQLFTYRQIEEESDHMFTTLYKILNVVIGTLALVITFMMGMLMNIYQSQRLVEFGLLQAIGYTKKQLLRRVIWEAVAVIVLGWLLGVLAAYGLLNLANAILMAPKAYALDTVDPQAYMYTLPLPFAILMVAVTTVVVRFRNFDPVGVVERRLV